MLSDEEIVLKRLKETLDVLKGKNVIGRLDFQIRDMVEDCIRVIEKQSKEIEELKDTRSIFNMGRRSYKNEIEDKIKAKIGIRKDEKEICKDSIEEKYLLREIYVLQSLLEKE